MELKFLSGELFDDRFDVLVCVVGYVVVDELRFVE